MSEITFEEKDHFILDESVSKNAKVKVIGVGGAGGNALNRMKEMQISNVEFIAVNTDSLALDHSMADSKIAIGKETTKNLGAGARPDVGRQAVQEDITLIEEKLAGADMIFIAAGMGGGTGTGAAPVIASTARKLGILTVAVVSMPFRFEGPIRKRNALKGLEEMRNSVDSIIILENQNIFQIIEKNTTTTQAFYAADEVLANAVRSICNIIMEHGNINLDFRDIRTIMENGGDSIMGTGVAEGEDRALDAARLAINCPLLGNMSIKGASGILVNFCHGANFAMSEMEAAMDYIMEEVGQEVEPEVMLGDCELSNMDNKVSITVIATGFKEGYNVSISSPAKKEEATISPVEDIPVREPSKSRETTNFLGLMLERSTKTLDTAAALTAPVDPLDLKPQKNQQEPKFLSAQETPIQVNKPTGYQDFRVDIREVTGKEEILNSPQNIESDSMTVYGSTHQVFPGNEIGFPKNLDEKKEPPKNESTGFNSNIDLDSMPDMRDIFLDDLDD